MEVTFVKILIPNLRKQFYTAVIPPRPGSNNTSPCLHGIYKNLKLNIEDWLKILYKFWPSE